MDFTQVFIVKNILNFYRNSFPKNAQLGDVFAGIDMVFAGKYHQPNLLYFSNTQIAQTANGENQTPSFIIEIISPRALFNKVHEKMEDYRAAGVKIVWHILPKTNQVHVYSGTWLNLMKVCKEEDICSASSVIPDFEITSAAIFEKPPLV